MGFRRCLVCPVCCDGVSSNRNAAARLGRSAVAAAGPCRYSPARRLSAGRPVRAPRPPLSPQDAIPLHVVRVEPGWLRPAHAGRSCGMPACRRRTSPRVSRRRRKHAPSGSYDGTFAPSRLVIKRFQDVGNLLRAARDGRRSHRRLARRPAPVACGHVEQSVTSGPVAADFPAVAS